MCGVALLALSALMRSLALLLGLMAGEGISDPITRMQVQVFAKVTRLDLPPSEGGCNRLAARCDDDILLPSWMMISSRKYQVRTMYLLE